jgi:hypothetical protein
MRLRPSLPPRCRTVVPLAHIDVASFDMRAVTPLRQDGDVTRPVVALAVNNSGWHAPQGQPSQPVSRLASLCSPLRLPTSRCVRPGT